MASGAPEEDGYNWRLHRLSPIKGCENTRSYYKCTHPNCEAKKKVDTIYTGGSHNHPKPPPNRRSGIGSSGTNLDMQIDGTEQTEQEGLAETNDEDEDEPESKRRKLEAYAVSTRASSEPRVAMQTTSDTDILDDGYHWRKTGQAPIKGNPNPRKYYKCAYAGCTVMKHVQREAHDFSSVLTTYRGRHTHPAATTTPIDIPDRHRQPLDDDGYRWRKCGQTPIKGKPNPRIYYRCTYDGCTVTKHVDIDSEYIGSVQTTYKGEHNHIVPEAGNSSHVGSSGSGTL